MMLSYIFVINLLGLRKTSDFLYLITIINLASYRSFIKSKLKNHVKYFCIFLIILMNLVPGSIDVISQIIFVVSGRTLTAFPNTFFFRLKSATNKGTLRFSHSYGRVL